MNKLNTLISHYNSTFSTYYAGERELYAHTSMALTSLYELGATDKRLEEFYPISTSILNRLSATEFEITDENWKDFKGEFNLESSYTRYFLKKIEEIGFENTIRAVFDYLMRGVGAAAFHPLIRLYYAVTRKDETEVAISLGTWLISYLDIGADTTLSGKGDIKSVLTYFEDYNGGIKVKGINIAKRMETISADSRFQENVNNIAYENLSPDILEENLLLLFSQENDFTILHGITSHHAFEYLSQFSENKEVSRIYYWKSLVAAYLSNTGFTKFNLSWKFPDISLPDWNELKKKAAMSDDDHVIKLVHTLSLKDKKLDYKLRYAASVKLGLI